MKYIKTILTIICLLLLLNLLKGMFISNAISSGMVDVNIKSVGGQLLFNKVLIVRNE